MGPENVGSLSPAPRGEPRASSRVGAGMEVQVVWVGGDSNSLAISLYEQGQVRKEHIRPISEITWRVETTLHDGQLISAHNCTGKDIKVRSALPSTPTKALELSKFPEYTLSILAERKGGTQSRQGHIF